MRHAPIWSGLLALALCLPSLGLGFFTHDDAWQQRLVLDRIAGRGGADPWYAIFDIIPDDPSRAAAERFEGLRPWWALDELRIRFLRPVSAATHYFDNLVFPDAPWAMHLHNALWYALLCFVVAALYRRVCTDPRIALAAALLYACDDAHISPAAWIANRNALIAGVFTFASVIAHDRARRDDWRQGRWLSPLLFSLGLLSAESAIGGVAFYVAYALCLDRGTLRGRVVGLLPQVAVLGAYLVVHRALGFGAHGSGLYIDPLGDPQTYLRRAPGNLLAQLSHQLSVGGTLAFDLPPRLVWAIVWSVPHVVMPAVGVYAALRFGRDRVLTFGVVSGLLALVPQLGLPPHERALLLPGVGLWLVTVEFGAWLVRTVARGRTALRVAAGALLLPLVSLHVLLSPPSLLLGVQRFGHSPVEQAAVASVLDDPPLLPTQTVVVLNVPTLFHAQSLIAQRRERGLPLPSRMHVLGTTSHPVSFWRIDAHTLQLQSSPGFNDEPLSRFWRSHRMPLRAGDHVALRDMGVTVLEVTPDGRPERLRVRFAQPLDDPSLRYIAWTGGSYREIRVPDQGAGLLLPAEHDPRGPARFVVPD